MFHTVEITRCRVLIDLTREQENQPAGDAVIDRGSRDSADFVTIARSNPRYRQLSLLRDHDEFVGGWLILAGGTDGIPTLKYVSYEEPYDIFNTIDSDLAALGENLKKDATYSGGALPGTLARFCNWAEEAVLGEDGEQTELYISVTEYLLGLPWSLAGAIRARPTPIVSTFAGAMASRLCDRRTLHCGSFAAYLDPLGDLSELHDLAPSIGISCARFGTVDVRIGARATAVPFQRDVQRVDLLLYIGHGLRKEETSCLTFHLGRELSPTDLTGLPAQARVPIGSEARVAVVLSCWGGALDWKQSASDWEPDGLAYRLKACGFDYVITSLWPISPLGAKAFVAAFVELVGKGSIPQAFVAAYRQVLADFGQTRTYLEAGCLQLMG